jgi:hypothetical protein
VILLLFSLAIERTVALEALGKINYSLVDLLGSLLLGLIGDN